MKNVPTILSMPSAAALLAVGASWCPGAESIDPDVLKFFEKEVRPLLAAQCFDCHGVEKQKGGLRLDHIDHIRAGGDDFGPALDVSDPAKSPLLVAISNSNPDLQMPPKDPLSSSQVAILRKWVEMGAPWPEEAAEMTVGFKPGVISDEDRAWWAFQPVRKSDPPTVKGARLTEIDRFIHAALGNAGIKPSPEAGPEELLRRLSFDLHGLPPEPVALRDFVSAWNSAETGGERAEVYERLIDDMLASPRYGERWAQHWLDLARYAESDGYRQDAYRPNAWPYRDYVIRSLNEDKPYNQFVREQIAGDEIAPEDPSVSIATAFLRHSIYEYNQRDAEGQWKLILNEVTDVAADVFLGLSVQCAQCHDHKFDPILQKDYYRLQAFFNNITWREDAYLATRDEIEDYETKLARWRNAAAEPLSVIDGLLDPRVARSQKSAMEKFPEEVQAMWLKPREERSPYEEQVVQLAWRQAAYEKVRFNIDKLPEAEQTAIKEARARIAAMDLPEPAEPLRAFVIGETGLPPAPASFATRKHGVVETNPGFLTILHPEDAEVPAPRPGQPTSGRRSVLADWLASPDNPLSTRVIVNRVWQYHFGRGIVATASDFGRLGDLPSHPELLDWLTATFVEEGWSLKKLHRRILLSAAYRQTARRAPDQHILATDPENRLLWRFPPRRLDAEEARDAVLAVTGELDLTAGGEGQVSQKPRRSIYTRKIRNTQDEVLRQLDAPAGYASTPQRQPTTTATQSLLLFNGSWPMERARAMAARLVSEHYQDTTAQIQKAYQLAFGRSPAPAEVSAAAEFVRQQTALLKKEAPEPPPEFNPLADLGEQFPPEVTRLVKASKALRLKPGSTHEKLRVRTPEVEGARFFVEAVVTLDALYPDATVRTIVSRWNNGKTDPGWAFGVTSQKSAYQPNNLIMQLSGDDFQGTHTYEVVASDLRIPTGRAHYVAASVSNKPLEGRPYGGSITFYALDLTNPGAVMQSVTVPHEVVGGYIDPKRALIVGGRDGDTRSLWEGGIAQVIVSNGERKPEWKPMQTAASNTPCIVNLAEAPLSSHSSEDFVWESSARAAKPASQTDPAREALKDFCHILINSNEFFYLH